MGGVIGVIIAAVVGGVVAIGGTVGLVAAQGGGSYPQQNTTPFVAYGQA